MSERIHVDHNRCPACNGAGRVPTRFGEAETDCRVCGGSGRLASPEQWEAILDGLAAERNRRATERGGGS